jgi:hypothetical protein
MIFCDVLNHLRAERDIDMALEWSKGAGKGVVVAINKNSEYANNRKSISWWRNKMPFSKNLKFKRKDQDILFYWNTNNATD